VTLRIRLLETPSEPVHFEPHAGDALPILELVAPAASPRKLGRLRLDGERIEGHPDQPRDEPWQLDALVAGALCRIYLDRLGVLASLSKRERARLAIGLGSGAAWHYTENRYRAQAGQPLRSSERAAGLVREDSTPLPTVPLSGALRAVGRADLADAAPWASTTTRWG
jgi:hypothetical protein